MPHIHNEPGQIDATVTAYVCRKRHDELEIMLHMHKKLGILLPVGGHIELDETPWQAVAHELEEESGYELSQLRLLQPKLRLKWLDGAVLHPQPLLLNTHAITNEHCHSDITYAFFTEDEPRKHLSEGESHDIRWLTKQAITVLDESIIYANTRAVCDFILTNFDTWELVETSRFSLEKSLG